MAQNTHNTSPKVGLIATGDELTQGDILNTNGQIMAQQLHELGFALPQQLIADDIATHITAAIHYQAEHCDIIILSGGLGPTSDDCTRYALAHALECELMFDETSWQTLVNRLKNLNVVIHDSNRQQAMFPADAEILPNPYGTAAGCYIKKNNKHYFMLPGPPRECLPMFNDYVIPKLLPTAQKNYKFKWLLLGANEGEIAAKIDTALETLPCRTGYRWAYPYLEIKVFTENAEHLSQAELTVFNIVAPYLISKNNISAEQLLYEALKLKNLKLHFAANPLSQWIKMQLIDASNIEYFSENAADVNITIEGFEHYWRNEPPPLLSEIHLLLENKKETVEKKFPIYYRDEQVKNYLAALACKAILLFIDAYA